MWTARLKAGHKRIGRGAARWGWKERADQVRKR
jgi:hypothetical protein